ncbi:MAG TPA: hypothetical protein VFM54_16660 [Micromonosporaceae bacterium]|nr:hypothetical protein [Micromonosporaceae bacterium]
MAGRDPEIHIRTSADTSDLDKLDRKIERSTGTIRELAKQIARTDDAAKRADLEKAFGDEHRALGKLRRLKKAIVEVGDEARHGARAGTGGGLFGQALGSPLLPVGIAAGTALAPAIGAAVNAGILAGVGGGALAAGIASAVRDPAVKAAFGPLRQEAAALADDIGQAYKAPTIAAAAELRSTLAEIRGDWAEGIGDLAGLVAPLSRGLGGLLRKATPGGLKMLTAAKPIIADLAVMLPGLGEDLDTMFESFAAGGEGAREGMRLLVQSVGDLAVVTGETVEVLSKTYDVVSDLAEATPALSVVLGPMWGAMARSNRELEATSGISGQVTAALDGIAGAARGLGVDLDGMTDAWAGLVDLQRGQQDAAIGWEQALDDLSESVRENGRSLDIGAQKGRDNATALLRVADAAKRVHESNLAQKMPVEQANALYAAQVKQLVDLAAKLGLSRVEVDKLIGALGRIPKAVVIDVGVRGLAAVPAAGGRGRVAMSHGGPIEGPGPRGVDSVPVLAAPGEYMMTGRMVEQAGGVEALERWRKGGNPYAVAMAGGGMGRSAGGGTTVRQPIQVQLVVSGKVLAETLVEHAVDTGRSPAELWSGARR